MRPEPTWVEIRTYLFPGGLAVLAALLLAAATAPAVHLWQAAWFIGLVALSSIMLVVGLYGYVAHYEGGSVPLVMIAAVIVMILLGSPMLATLAVALATFATALYFLRLPSQVVSRELLDKGKIEAREAGFAERSSALQAQLNDAQQKITELESELEENRALTAPRRDRPGNEEIRAALHLAINRMRTEQQSNGRLSLLRLTEIDSDLRVYLSGGRNEYDLVSLLPQLQEEMRVILKAPIEIHFIKDILS